METWRENQERWFSRLFLSYLWGMETRYARTNQLAKLRSYPTYEEWKRYWRTCRTLHVSRFLSYLWGMETTEPHKRYRLLTFVLILPMRNGNKWLFGVIWQYIDVLILPMRNGNVIPSLLAHILAQEVLILPMRNGNYHILYVVVQKL